MAALSAPPPDGGNGAVPLLRSIVGPDEASVFLDAYLLAERGWFPSIKRLAAFTIPAFEKRYFELIKAIVERQEGAPESAEIGERIDASDFENRFNKEAKRVAKDLNKNASALHPEWCDTKFGVTQVKHARDRISMRFDKAIIAALTLNALSNAFGFEDQFSIGRHEIVASVFYFSNMWGFIRKIPRQTGHDADGHDGHMIGAIASVLDLSEETVKALAGGEPEKYNSLGYEKAATTVASFKTQWDIYTFLQSRLETGSAPALKNAIVRRRSNAKHLEAARDENILEAQKITVAPFAWPVREGDVVWPPNRFVKPAADGPPEPAEIV